jgi:hypothetical protein
MLFRLHDVTKTYGKITALQNLSVEALPGAVQDPTKKLSWATTSRRSSHLTIATIFPTGPRWDAMNGFLILLWKKALEK